MKKLISTIMCLALLVGCLAGCGGNTQTGAADGKGLKMLRLRHKYISEGIRL